MTNPGIHEKINPLLVWYVNGSLDGAEEEQVRQHLRDCPACTEELDTLAEVADVLSLGPIPEEASAGGIHPPAEPERVRPGERSRIAALPLAAALLAAGILVGWLGTRLLPGDGEPDLVRGSVRLLDLGGGRSRDAAGGTPVHHAEEADDLIVLLLRAPLTGTLLALDLIGPEGPILTQPPSNLRRDALGRIAVAVGSGQLREPGDYEIVIREEGPEEVARTFRYPFRVEPSP